MMTRAWAALAAASIAGCEAVPSLTFEEADASVSAEAGDAGRSDAVSDASCGVDATVCCGATPCYGALCSQQSCSLCDCKPAYSCCTKTSGAPSLICVSNMALAAGCH